MRPYHPALTYPGSTPLEYGLLAEGSSCEGEL